MCLLSFGHSLVCLGVWQVAGISPIPESMSFYRLWGNSYSEPSFCSASGALMGTEWCIPVPHLHSPVYRSFPSTPTSQHNPSGWPCSAMTMSFPRTVAQVFLCWESPCPQPSHITYSGYFLSFILLGVFGDKNLTAWPKVIWNSLYTSGWPQTQLQSCSLSFLTARTSGMHHYTWPWRRFLNNILEGTFRLSCEQVHT